jgi:hypothetical protein
MKSNRTSTSLRFATVLLFSLLAMASVAVAQLPVPASSQFDITGFIQSATLGGPGTGPGVGAHMGGMITVNGHVIIVPSETIVILPASALTWQELFAFAPAPYTGVATGMAQADVPAPLTTYEAHVVGNRVLGGPGGADVYIAGLIWITQQGLNSGQGFINCISYANPVAPEIFVGGLIGNCATGARLRINDPAVGLTGTGRYTVAFTPDARFTVDQDNPTIASITGFPMCIPRVDPNVGVDPLCPLTQRPLVGTPAATAAKCAAPTVSGPGVFCTSFTMGAPPVAVPGTLDPTVQAPFMVGDFVTYAGTLVQDASPATPTVGPFPGAASTYIAAHTMVNNTAIYTAGGTDPAYVSIEVSLIGTGGLTVIGANEAAIRTRFEGFTSDVDAGVSPGSPTNTFPSQRLIKLYGIDLTPPGAQPPAVPGATSDRFWGQISVDPGPPTGAAKGRWRFRPPCDPFGTVEAKPDKQCVMNQANTFLPPTREVRAVIGASADGTKAAAFVAPITVASPTTANGIVYGQYHAPIGEYIFPEQLPGMAPIPENNFNTMPFLAAGGYTSAGGTIVGQLNPWPSNVVVIQQCTALATANAGGSYTVASGGTVTLNGSGSAPDAILTYAWTVDVGTLSNPAIPNPVYTAPLVGAQTVATATLTVTTCAGASAPNSAPITINAVTAPTVDPIAPVSVFSGANGLISPITGSDPNVPALTPLTFNATQVPAGTLNPFTVNQLPPTGATINFTAPLLPANQLVPTVVNVCVTATNTANVPSAPQCTPVTVNPVPDAIQVASAEYRTSLKRLIITVNDANPFVTLKLQSYVTTTGTTYNPDPAAGGVGNVFTNNNNGTYSLTLNGVPGPACGNAAGYQTPCPTAPLDVKSNIQNVPGDTGFFALTRIRQ